MRVVVTRPVPEAARWVEALAARGHQAVTLPLLAIAPAPDPQAVAAAWTGLAQYRAVMFVSGNAVQGFFAGASRSWPAGVRAWAPGPATREALLAAGVPATQVDAPAADAAQFDSEHLWARVQGQLGADDRLLLVRGAGPEGRGEGRDWLARQLAQAGAAVDEVIAYSRGLPVWSAEQRAQACDCTRDALWLFSSSEAARNLATLLPDQDWRPARALVTHPRIAETVRALGFGHIDISRPGLAEVLASIESTR